MAGSPQSTAVESVAKSPRSILTAALALAGVAVALLLPLSVGPYELLLLTGLLAFGLFALSYDLVLGVTGLISICHATLFGAGAYGLAIAMEKLGWSFWPAALFGAVLSGVLALLIGFFSTRSSGAGFIIMTVIFAQALYTLAHSWVNVTGGEDGLILTVSRVKLFGLSISTIPGSHSLYYATLAVLLVSLLVAYRLVYSRFGLVLRGIKGREERAAALGYPVNGYKIAVNVIAGMLAGVAGIMYGLSYGFVSVNLIAVALSIEVIIWTIVGGPGSLIGPVLSAIGLGLLIEYFRGVTEYYMMIFGVIIVFVVLVLPDGVGGLVRRLLRSGRSE